MWNADINANRFHPTYIDGYLDISGGTTKIRGNLYVGTGTLEQTSQVYNQQPSITNDNSLSGDLFINGNVLINSPGTLNVTGDISINGFLSVDSYVNGSIPLTALASGGGGGGNSGYYVQNNTTIITKEMEYSNSIQINADISTNTTFTNFASDSLHVIFNYNDKISNINLVGGGSISNDLSWNTYDVSDTGEYMIAGVYEGNLWISADYGETWRELSGASGDYAQVSGATQKWHDVAISGDGSIMMAKWGPVGAVQGILYRSEDYGKTWFTLSYNGITFHEQGDQVVNGTVPFVMSKDGNYIYSFSNPYGVNANYGTNSPVFEAVYSHDGGANWHNVVTTRSWMTNIWTSRSGKYVLLGIYGGSGRDDTMVKYSNDYGVTYNIFYHLKYPSITFWTSYRQYMGGIVLDNGLLYVAVNGNPIYRFDVSNAIISPYDASFNISDASLNILPNSASGASSPQIAVTEDGKNIIHVGYQIAGQPRYNQISFSGDYGTTFTTNQRTNPSIAFYSYSLSGTPPGNSFYKIKLFERNHEIYALYTINLRLYISRIIRRIDNPTSSLYVGPSTTIKLKQDVSAILLENGSSISSSNIASGSYKNNNVVFRDSSFNNMTVTGAFTSSQLNDPSDYRIKTDIQDLNETHILDNLRPVKFYQTQLGQTQIGFLAHELQEYYPELVDGEKDGAIMQSVNYNGLLAVLIHEVQQLKTRVANKRARNLVA